MGYFSISTMHRKNGGEEPYEMMGYFHKYYAQNGGAI